MSRLAAARLAATLCVALSACGGDDDVDPSAAQSSAGYRLYYLGSSFRGHRLTDVVRGPGETTWSFIYGSCDPGDDEGCAPPVEVQNWSACERYWRRSAGRGPGPTAFRGARVARTPALEVYTGRTTVVIFGGGRNAARALRPVGSRAAPPTLPFPAPGSLRGRLRCRAT